MHLILEKRKQMRTKWVLRWYHATRGYQPSRATAWPGKCARQQVLMNAKQQRRVSGAFKQLLSVGEDKVTRVRN